MSKPAKSRRLVAILGAACAVAAGARAAETVAVKGGAVALNLMTPSPQDLSSGAAVGVDLPTGSMKAQATAAVGRQGNDQAIWQKNAARVDAKVAVPLGTSLSVSGQDESGFTYRAPESVGASDSTSHMVRNETRSVHASFSVPVGAVKVTLGGKGASVTTQDTSKHLPAAGRAVVNTEDSALLAKAEWQPRQWLDVEGGAAVHTADITWREQRIHNGTYRSLDPHVSVSVKPWDSASVMAKLEHKVSPYDTAAFAGYAAANPSSLGAAFEPNHAWVFQMQMEQKVGPAALSATYTGAREGSVTEFAEQNGVQAPVSTHLDRQDEVAVAASVPLAGIGLPGTQFSSQAEWQSSRVVDPVTHQLRGASGEIPRKVTLRVSHNLPTHDISLGLTGEFVGPRTSYQVSEVSSTGDVGSLGAFLKYKPGDYEVELNVNGLYGGATENAFYKGLRGSSEIDRTVMQDNSGPLINLSLHKAL